MGKGLKKCDVCLQAILIRNAPNVLIYSHVWTACRRGSKACNMHDACKCALRCCKLGSVWYYYVFVNLQ